MRNHKEVAMSTLTRLRYGALTPFDWSGLSLFPFLAPSIRLEEFLEGDTYIIKAELPGIDPVHDLSVMVAEGELRLHAERLTKREEKTRSEFHYGTLYRGIPLPAGAKLDTITAEYADGILTVKMLVGEPEKLGKTIPVTVTAGGKTAKKVAEK
jgi:HSP20 family protein